MKQKYSLMVADMQISVVADADPAQVEKIVGILDRRMREINLQSPSCSKNEAAILCALDFCAERLAMQDQVSELENRNDKYAAVLAAFKEQVAELQTGIGKLKAENEMLRRAIEAAPEAPKPVTPSEFLAQVADAQTGAADQISIVETAPEVVAEVPVTEAAEEKPKAKSRSRVGSMFDLLSFNDV